MEALNKNRRIADTFRVLSVETRVRIIRLLAAHGPLCVGALAEELQVSSGAVSQHLRVMRDNGLVEDERRGYYIHYFLRSDLRPQLEQLVKDLFMPDKKVAGAVECEHEGKSSCPYKAKSTPPSVSDNSG